MRFRTPSIASFATMLLVVGTSLPFTSGVADAGTAGNREALADAKEYLSSEAFSLQGLNWSKEALASAKQYLSTEAFSQGGLIGQLEYDKFTAAQATYGVARCGANWNTEAYKDAKQYLSTEAFSLSGLISQLEYDKFTAAQATYGANKAY
jgi:hypothetical protein